MKYLRTLFASLLLTAPLLASAQQTGSEQMKKEKDNPMISSEVTVKAYTVDQGDHEVTNKVRIETMKAQEVALEDSDKNEVNQDRKYPEKSITKRVWIDNNADDAYDETLTFRYKEPHGANVDSDFVLVSNDKELFVAVNEGESLKILESARFMKQDFMNTTTKSVVYTNNDGESINFYIENFKLVDASDQAMK